MPERKKTISNLALEIKIKKIYFNLYGEQRNLDPYLAS
jgi:hypothetical protein